MEYIFLTTAIVGFVEFIKAINGNDWETAEIILGCAVIGGACGLNAVDGLTVVTGIQAGLSAAGAYTGAQLIGGTK